MCSLQTIWWAPRGIRRLPLLASGTPGSRYEGEIWYDYIRRDTTGAYAWIPEPSQLAMLLLGAGLLGGGSVNLGFHSSGYGTGHSRAEAEKVVHRLQAAQRVPQRPSL